jgi:hypothetical protein
VKNNGTNLNNTFFDIRTASADARTPDLPLYTLQNRTTFETVQTSDVGRGNVTGRWSDIPRFALSPRARRTSTTASPRRSRTWSCTTKTCSAASSSPSKSEPTWSPS